MLYAIFCIFFPFLSDPITCDAALSNRWLNLALLLLAALAAVYYAALSAPGGAARPSLEAAEIAAKAAAAAAEKAAAEAAAEAAAAAAKVVEEGTAAAARAAAAAEAKAAAAKAAAEAAAAAAAAAEAEALASSTFVEERPLVKELLAAHASEVRALREAVKGDALFDAAKHDELWLLRFLLSQKKDVAKAAKAVATTLAWRKSNRMDELAAELKELERKQRPLEEHRFIRKGFETYIAPGGMRFVHPNPTRGPILVASMVQFDYNAAMRKLTRAEYTNINLAMNEWNAMQCDVVTRATGRLTKAARLVSCKGFRVGSLNRQWLKLDGDVAKEMQDCYPQLLGVIICLDPPQWALVMWRAVKILFPPRMVEKVDLLSTKDRALKPRLQRYMDVRDMERILSSPPLA